MRQTNTFLLSLHSIQNTHTHTHTRSHTHYALTTVSGCLIFGTHKNSRIEICQDGPCTVMLVCMMFGFATFVAKPFKLTVFSDPVYMHGSAKDLLLEWSHLCYNKWP